jgi:hypothetical protein
MSLTPGSLPTEQSTPAAPPPPPRRNRLLRICFAIFVFEMGLFLIIYPWRDTWTFNYFQGSSQILELIWDDPFFKGALSGLGLVNVYLALTEFVGALKRT